MNATLAQPLADSSSRLNAVAAHDRSLLVEAGAGSGKTAVMAGRIAMMLAEGIAPRSIAAVTFTELAASELVLRVRAFVAELIAGRVPIELAEALPDGLVQRQRQALQTAANEIDEITCSTIHGFCQRLIKPYPVEANIDPGATVMDSDQADRAFNETIDFWLREELSRESGNLIAELVIQDPKKTVNLINTVLGQLRKWRTLVVDAPIEVTPTLTAFVTATEKFRAFVRGAEADEPETESIAAKFSEMAGGLASLSQDAPGAALARLLMADPHRDLCTAGGTFRAYQRKTAWDQAARHLGYSKADGARLFAAAKMHYRASTEAWTSMKQAVAARVLGDLLDLVRPAVDQFRDYKRSAALLDFDDLIFAARDLLRDHEYVRQALARRYARVLVDEFQDTDPVQTEIFWRLCGDPTPGDDASDWTTFQIRPGALFLVGDPKQAIYRFRGADVAAYIKARNQLHEQNGESIQSISTNFRALEPILTFVNQRFERPLSATGQPGYTALDAFHKEKEGQLCVAALDVAVADENGKPSSIKMRDGEAEALSEMCARLIGSKWVTDRKTGKQRPCRAGDIALLAPTGNDLWRYEEALEARGIPVATQAGKGLYRRQEIQDLIAITRVLADQRDTLALGALLRGPLVGLTEEELLDIVWDLPRSGDGNGRLPRFDLGVDPEHIKHSYARKVIEKLQALRRQANSTTPYTLLSQAVDVLRMRPILLGRHRNQAERALANVDLYLSFSRAYGVRGLRAFAEAMTAAWSDGTRAVEGRTDAQEEAVALYSMHAAKGLEWPVVVPINTMTQIKGPDSAIVDRTTGRFYCPVFGVKPTGYDTALKAEKDELSRERVRLWYVATTRACELLVLPRSNVDGNRSSWSSLVDLNLHQLPALELSEYSTDIGTQTTEDENRQTREIFAAEAATIVQRQRNISWIAPSRDETAKGNVYESELPELFTTTGDGEVVRDTPPSHVKGSLERGIILHKLIEEVLTGETEYSLDAVESRAAVLIRELDISASDSAHGLVSAELAGTVLRTLAIPDIAALRTHFLPELHVYSSEFSEEREEVIAGIADAIAFDDAGKPSVIVDWKSDVAPSFQTIDHYRSQVRAYLDVTKAERGLIVFMTTATVVPVTRSRSFNTDGTSAGVLRSNSSTVDC
jgi:exodeoxyribonuclease-5